MPLATYGTSHRWRKTAAIFTLLICAGISLPAYANSVRPGGEYYLTVNDLSVKVLGGEVKMARTWSENRWHINRRWNALEIELDTITSSPKKIFRNTNEYLPANTANTVFEFDDQYQIRISGEGYRWEDREGNWIEYDSDGQIEKYGDNNNVTVHILRDVAGRITGVADHFNAQVIWYEYDGDIVRSIRDVEDPLAAGTREVVYEQSGGNLSSVTDVRGNPWRYTYSGTNLRSITDPEDRVRTLHYDANGRVILIEDPLGTVAEYSYDFDTSKDEFYIRKINSTGRNTESWYDRDYELRRRTINGVVVRDIQRDGNSSIETDRAGYKTHYKRDQWDRLTQVSYPDGGTMSYQYLGNRAFRTEDVNENGVVTHHQYDANGNRTQTTEAVGTASQRTMQYTYDEYGQILSMTRVGDSATASATTQYVYDNQGNLTQITDPELQVTTFTYDIMGNELTRRDTRSNTWRRAYDNAGNLIEMTSPAGALQGYSQRYEYDKVGNRVAEIAANGQTTAMQYDARNRMITRTAITGKPAIYGYDGEGRILSMTDEEGHKIQYRYDSEGRRLAEIDGNGNTTLYEYTEDGIAGSNARNQPAAVNYPTYRQTFKYDKRSRLIESTDVLPDGTRYKRTLAYDLVGNLVHTSDEENRTKRYEYDALNRMTADIDALGVRTEMTYDSRDNLLSVTTGPNNGQTRFEYDRNNRQTAEIQPLGQIKRTSYDGEGNVTQVIDRDGRHANYTYDIDNRLINEVRSFSSVPDQTSRTIVYSHNSINRLTGYDDGITTGVYAYDEYGRKTGEQVNYGAFDTTVGYSWYANGQLKTVTDPGNNTVTYAYDNANLWSAASIAGAGSIVVNTREWQEPTRMTYPGGTTREMSYTPRRYLDTLDVTSPLGVSELSYDYTHTPSGNIAGIQTQYGDKQYGYDLVDRLTSAINPTLPDEAFTYDSRGNRLTDEAQVGNWTYNENNELESTPQSTYSYDANGSRILSDDGTTALLYDYNESGRLSGISETGDAGSTTVAEYEYDPFGRRVWKEVNGNRTYFMYSDQGLIAELNSDGAIQRTYGYRSDRTWMTDPLYLRDDVGNTYYYQNDHLGTPQKLTNVAGQTVWAQESSAFGDARVVVSTVENQLRFAGQYFDGESGAHYNFHRDYDSAIGRYVESDPIGLQGGLNIYGYAFQNPARYSDPSGQAVGVIVPVAECLANPICRTGILVILSAGAISNSGDSINTESTTTSARGECDSCKTRHSAHLLCGSLRGLVFNSKNAAYGYFGEAGARFHNRSPLTNVQCAGTAGAGWHWNLRVGSRRVGSITSCTCCQDTAKGPVLKTKYIAHP